MNYRHIYHAGHFADVVKHITLISLLQKLKSKDKPFAVLDAFAGIGIYDLASDEAQKTGESSSGIRRLLKLYNRDSFDEDNVDCEDGTIKCTNDKIYSANASIIEYLDIVRRYNVECKNDIVTAYYPGSPAIISSLLRQHDRLIACELHEQDYITLKKNMKHPVVEIHHIDAYQAVKALWPPKEKRGLILFDPPFEVANEFDKIIEVMYLIKRRFANGMTMLWYPIKNTDTINSFYKKYKKIGYNETLMLEFDTSKLQNPGLQKCGILISNPPDIKKTLEETMQYLIQDIYNDLAEYKVTVI